MATTTNYGWTTPDDTALVKDGAAAIRTLGSSVDTTTKNLNPSTTLGDIEYRSSTANTNTRLGIGTNGQVLNVSGGVPAWTTLSSGGMSLLSTTTFSGTTTTVSSISQSYKHLLIQINGMTNSGNLNIRLNGSTTGAYLSGIGYTSTGNIINGTINPNFTHNSSTTASDLSMILWIYSYSDTARDKPISASYFFNSTFPDPISGIFGGYWNDNTAVSSIDFVTGTSTSTGTIRLWGVS
jgi:hypothetical protein